MIRTNEKTVKKESKLVVTSCSKRTREQNGPELSLHNFIKLLPYQPNSLLV